MMNLRILSVVLLASVGAVLSVSAAASATTLTYAPALFEELETPFTGNLVAKSEGHVVLHNPIANVECASQIESEIESHGKEVPATGTVNLLAFTGCTSSWHVTTVSGGSLQVEETEADYGTVVSSGATIEATRLGVTCRYKTNNTTVGTLTGTSATEDYATLHLEAAIPFHSGSFLCGAGAVTWTGSYEVTTPSALVLQKQPNKKPKIGVEPKVKGFEQFEEGKSEVIFVVDKTSPEAYVLEEVTIAAQAGSEWGNEGGSCANIKVEKEKPENKLCEVKVKCGKKGGGLFGIHYVLEGDSRVGFFRMKCV